MREDKKNIAIKNSENVCFNCLKETEVHKIHIGALGYGSGFDNFSTRLNLCNDCYEKTDKNWWKLEVKMSGYEEEYKYENEIFNFVKQMPIEGQELFHNKFSQGACAEYMESQDWIDYELDILPHEKCKEYGMYSPQEIQAYNDRFPNCKQVKIKVYGDGSKGSKCFRSAFGDDEGKCDVNISGECYMCDSFEEREGEIIVVDELEEFYERETERLNHMIQYAQNRLEMIKNKTLTED